MSRRSITYYSGGPPAHPISSKKMKYSAPDAVISLKKRKRKPRSKQGKKAAELKQIVKKVVMKTAETKSFLQSSSMSLAANSPRVENICSIITQGTGGTNVLGEKMFIENIRYRGILQWSGSLFVGTSNTPRIVRMVVFHSKEKLTTSQTSLTVAQLFRQDHSGAPDTGNLATKGHIDLHAVTLLHDQQIVIESRDLGTTAAVADQIYPWSFNIPIKKTKYVERDNGNYFKDGAFYFAAVFDDIIASTAGAITLNYTFAVNFKDN